MIDFSAVRKFIYFPRMYERHNQPYQIHVLDKWGINWRGHASLELLLAREFNYFEINRCQPYSDELWQKCMEWVTERDLLEAKYMDLMERGS